MGLDTALSIASGGLSNVSAQLALVSHNVANAGTTGYISETLPQTSLSAGGIGMGVRTGVAIQNLDQAVQTELFSQNATVSGLAAQQAGLQQINTALGSPTQGNDLSSEFGTLQSAFTTLANNPSNAVQQQQVVSAAQRLASGINALSNTYTATRQNAENGVISSINTLNTALGTIGSLSDQIMNAQSMGLSTADLQSQRDAAMTTVSQLLNVQFINQPNGNVIVATSSGLILPTHGVTNPLSTSAAVMAPSDYANGGGIPPIMLGGVDVTAQLQGGKIGANLTLRDTTLPNYQAQLDEFSQNLASRFSAQGLTLFTNAAGTVPVGGGVPTQSGYVGFAAEIQVNPAILAQPALVVDGTNAIAGSATGATAFTPNPPGGEAGFTTLVSRVLNYTFGADVQSGVAQPASNISGLGPQGNLTAPFGAPTDLSAFASTLVASQSADATNVNSQLSQEQSVQTTLQGTMQSVSGVSIDNEMANMVVLQNAYGANARILAAVQQMWTDLTNIPPFMG